MKQILRNVLFGCRTFARKTLLLTFRNNLFAKKATQRTTLVQINSSNASHAVQKTKNRANRGFENFVFDLLLTAFFGDPLHATTAPSTLQQGCLGLALRAH